MTTLVNDVHSMLNETSVGAVARPRSLAELQSAVLEARGTSRALALCGGRHAMGGQQFCSGGLLVDTSNLDRVLSLDPARGLVEVEAGIQWPALFDALEHTPWAVRQKQTGADDLSVGGAISANVHGRGLAMRPFVADVESLVLVDAAGNARRCSRTENSDLFRLACGGYGLFGAIYSAELRLVWRRKIERVVALAEADDLMELLRSRIDDGFVYGDFQFEINPHSDGFLRHGIVSCYRPVPDDTQLRNDHALEPDDWGRLLELAHTDKARAFELYSRHYLGTSGQVYLSDRHQLATYVPGYHWAGSSEMITELYVPRAQLTAFLADAARELRRRGADVVYGTVRLIEKDDETFLAWATEPWACIVLNLHVDHAPAAIERAADAFRALIDVALAHGGSYYLTYHRWARRDQVEQAYPQIREFANLKDQHDPAGIFRSDWYGHLLGQLELREAAA